LVSEHAKIFNIPIVIVKDWRDIRDAVMNGEPSYISIEKARKVGKVEKISPKCYCAAIIEYGDIKNKILEIRNLNKTNF